MQNFLRSFTMSICMLAASISVAPTAFGQNFYQGGISQSAQSGSAAGVGAPIFSTGNYEGDAREGNLYSYNHPVSWQPWNTYRMLLQQISQQDMSSAGSNLPPPVQANGPAGFMTGYSNLSGAGAAMQAIPSVTGTLLNGSPSSTTAVPGLVDSGTTSVSSTMSPGMNGISNRGSATTVMPMDSLQPPMPEYVPGLVPPQ